MQDFLVNYHTPYGPANNCCSWLTIGDVINLEYNGNKYKQIELLTDDEQDKISVNFSQFVYPMFLIDSTSDIRNFLACPSEATCISTVDDRIIDPEQFFYDHKGDKLLYIYCFNAINAFNKTKRCYRFAYENVSASYIKNYIISTRKLVLKKVMDSPSEDTPGTILKFNGSRPFLYDAHSNETLLLVNKIFNDEFKKIFEEKFEECTLLNN